jgi:hypothetical protein
MEDLAVRILIRIKLKEGRLPQEKASIDPGRRVLRSQRVDVPDGTG